MKRLIISCMLVAASILATSCAAVCRPIPFTYKPRVPNGYYTQITLRATERGLPSPITITPADVVLPDKPAFFNTIANTQAAIKINGYPKSISWIISHYNVTAVTGKPVCYPYDIHKCCCFEVSMSELVDICF